MFADSKGRYPLPSLCTLAQQFVPSFLEGSRLVEAPSDMDPGRSTLPLAEIAFKVFLQLSNVKDSDKGDFHETPSQ